MGPCLDSRRLKRNLNRTLGYGSLLLRTRAMCHLMHAISTSRVYCCQNYDGLGPRYSVRRGLSRETVHLMRNLSPPWS